jgi:cyclopropane-fatty-acyl-phospholipid synthase
MNDRELGHLDLDASLGEEVRSHAASRVAPRLAARGNSLEARLLRRLIRSLGDPPIEVTLWNGDVIVPSGVLPQARLLVRDRAALALLLLRPDLNFGEGYMSGRLEVEGNLVQFLEAVYRGASATWYDNSLLERLMRALQQGRRNTLAGSRANIHHHYDIGNEFYSLWLGSTMAYTCAYFPSPSATLDEAQEAKMRHVSQKLRLRSGEHVVEAGCGWGTLALHMARHYGVKVKAFNISRQQIDYARQRAKVEGLADRVEYIEDDYRNISGSFDVFVSVGMLEHVGPANYHELGRVIRRSLKSPGRGLIHSIGRNRARPMNAWIEKRIFPGAYPPTLAEMTGIFEPWGYSVLDVENLRLHYAKTLEHWLNSFEQSSAATRRMFDEQFVRTWRLYLAGSLAAFNTGDLQLFQVLFADAVDNDLPWTRQYMYQA